MALANQTVHGDGALSRQAESTVARGSWPLASLILGLLSAIGIAVTLWMALIYAPTDAIQGEPQRIYYLHVPMAVTGMLAFGVLAVAGIVYLIKRDERWDWLARASAEVGTVFLTIALATGMLWGKPIWGAWWVWDPKLTATLILWFMFVGYLMLRSYWGRNDSSAKGGAVVGIVGVIDVPIIYFSVDWWRGQHPAQTTDMPEQMAVTILVALVTFLILYSFFMVQAYQLQRLQTLAQRLRTSIEE